jgi:hypothetical protein
VQEIERHLPLTGDDARRLAERPRTDGRRRRRLRSIAERGHLAGVSIDRMTRRLREAGLDEEHFLDDDRLGYDDAIPFDLAYLLNEDFFQAASSTPASAAIESRRASPQAAE